MANRLSISQVWQSLCSICTANVYRSSDFGGEHGLYHELEISEFRGSRRSGCVFCVFLDDTFSSRDGQWKSWTDKEGWLYVTFGVNDLLSSSGGYGRWHDGLGCITAMVEFDVPEGNEVHSPEIRLGDDGALLITSYERNDPKIRTKDDRVSLNDHKCLQVGRDWLQRCLSQHTLCISTQQGRPRYPSRLLQITKNMIATNQDVKLVDTATFTSMPEYLALSYCWGGPQEFSTVSTNLNELQKGFSSSELVGSVYDAIRVAHALDVQYLWVDAICIIQDVVQDKLNEIPAMDEIYAQALVTVIAENTPIATHGFLRTFERKTWTLPYLDMDNEQSAIEVHEISNLRSILRSRAWTMQESMMSNRKIIFGPNTISWRCHQHEEIDLTQQIGPYQPAMEIFDQKYATAQPRHLHQNRAGAAWLEILEDYTSRDMSVEDDKLLAISGLATRVAKQMSWSYVAGFWRETLHMGLVWSVNSAMIQRGSLKRQVVHPSRYLAPSWSWASIIGPIEWSYIKTASAPRSCCEVRSCHVELESANAPFGQVVSGQIVLDGPLIYLPLIDRRNIQSALDQESCFFQLPILTLQSQTWITADTVDIVQELCGHYFYLVLCASDPRAGDPQEMVVGPMSTFESSIWTSLSLKEFDPVCQPCTIYSTSSFEGIILKPDVTDNSAFRRVGHWRAEARKATIDLVKRKMITLV